MRHKFWLALATMAAAGWAARVGLLKVGGDVALAFVRQCFDYASHQTGRAPAAEFYRELNRQYATDVDLEELIQASRNTHAGLVL